MARNYNYPTAVFFLLCIGFYKITIIIIIIIIIIIVIIRAEK